MTAFRVAVAGKGGAGKTTLSATLARLMARQGRRVVVIDADSNPNVAVALGLEPERAAAIAPLPPTLVSRRFGGPALSEPVADVVARHGVQGPDAVAVVHMAMPAHADEGCLCSSHATVSALLADAAGDPGATVIVDLEASPEHFSRGTTRHVDALVLVVEPYYRSLETARRMAQLAAELPIGRVTVVANKVRSPGDAAAIAEFCDRHGLDRAGCLPWSDEVLEADRAGSALIDHDPSGPYVEAVAGLAGALVASGVAVPAQP